LRGKKGKKRGRVEIGVEKGEGVEIGVEKGEGVEIGVEKGEGVETGKGIRVCRL